MKGNGEGKSQGNLRYLVFSYLRLEGISDFEGNRPVNHQNSLKSRPGNNRGINYHRWLYNDIGLFNTYHESSFIRKHWALQSLCELRDIKTIIKP